MTSYSVAIHGAMERGPRPEINLFLEDHLANRDMLILSRVNNRGMGLNFAEYGHWTDLSHLPFDAVYYFVSGDHI
jgi:hypothetical protein